MRILAFTFLVSIMLMGCNGSTICQSQSEPLHSEDEFVEYYSTIPLRETPYPKPMGVVRLTKEMAITRNHYEFLYDSIFRLKSITFKNGVVPVIPNHTSNYFFTSTSQKFDYSENMEYRTFYDRFGNRVNQRGAHREVYVQGEDGRYVALWFENENGNRIENDWGIFEYKWKRENDGSVFESRTNKKGELVSIRPGFEFYDLKLYYNPNGTIALMQNVSKEGTLIENSSGVAQDKLLFDVEGRWLGWMVLDANGKLRKGNGPNVAKGINKSDSFGYEKSITFEDVDGSNIINSHGFYGSIRNYDRFGNYALTHFINENGEPDINEQSGYCFAKYSWDNRGINRTMIELLNVKGEPVAHKSRGYSKIKQEYDSLDRLTQTTFLGVKGNPIDRLDNGISKILYSYDEKNMLISTKRFDSNGNKME
ncbi:hypothetical protein [Flagellimonas allohymeniacidonis]|uniref:Uncharacterized protein n=1 Tax=Flagellimonas allohymeniacidonis TaxID=2517819 RepID=A0A4Q8QGA2_9FLAO|nr:hypothetical protein [Allomuricauda hymeniacidonis]TAI47136.1 hypothetical protein EW142_10625 [Allomuricauda hymeniacidonis]